MLVVRALPYLSLMVDGGSERAEDGAAENEPPPFAYFGMRGDRFDAPGMPADAAAELVRFRDAVYTIARQLWLDAHPDRKRVPDGFEDAFDLRLTTVEEGSAVPRLYLNRAPKHSGPEYDGWYELFGSARDTLTAGIQAVRNHGELPSGFPRERMRPLRRFGGSLEEGEAITIGSANPDGPRAVLDESVRATLKSIEKVLEPQEAEVSAEGIIIEFDADGQTFHLRSPDYPKRIRCYLPGYERALSRLAKECLAEDGINGSDVLVRGLAKPRDDGGFDLIYDIREIEVITSYVRKIVRMRIERLEELEDGWLDDESLQPDRDFVSALRSAEQQFVDLGVSVSMGPHADGSIELEWVRGSVAFSALLNADSRKMELFLDDMGTSGIEHLIHAFNLGALMTFIRTGAVSE